MNRFLALMGLRSADQSVRETIEELIEEGNGDESATPMEASERELLRNILDLKGSTVADVMVTRSDIVAVEVDLPFEELIDTLLEAGHSRLPVYKETLDDVIGMVHIKDVFAASRRGEPVPIEKLIRKTLFVPPSTTVLDMLAQMRLNRCHLALVVDEYGGIDGLVSIEDLMEEIVGDIEDEHDEEEATPIVARDEAGRLVLDSRMPLEDLETRIGTFLTDEEREQVDTVGGLIFSLAGEVPVVGAVLTHPDSGFQFEVTEADGRRLQGVVLRNPPSEDSEASAVNES
jgi:CBS domain containing-hemolysin-like protein